MEVSEDIDVCLDGDPCLLSHLLGAFLGLLLDFPLKALSEARQEGCSSGKNYVVVEVYLKIVIAFLDRLEGDVCETVNL